MSICHNKWTFPGWIFCLKKPHPFGNEYHTACCDKSGIMFSIELVERKDHPWELGPQEFSKHGRTSGLLCMLKSYFGTGKCIVLDTGFCVLKSLVELRMKGLFACALIKKCRFLPMDVPGNEIDSHLNDIEVGETEVIQGSLDGIVYNL